MADVVVHLAFPAKPDDLLLARLVLSGLARSMPVGEDLLADLKLAITEACGNVVRHAYPDGAGDVWVSYVVSDGVLQMIVEDQGVGYEWQNISDRPGATPVDGGMGMSIIRTIVDDLEVDTGADGRGTVVRMSRRFVPVEA
jgi:anti-sigma regulatory factor (Ser/Thr protein kinase)